MSANRSSALQRIALLTVTGAAAQLVMLLYRIALSRLAGAEIMGLYQLLMPVYSMVISFCAVGLTVATSYLSAERVAVGDRAGVKGVRRGCLRIFFGLLAPVFAAVLVFSDPISAYLLGDARTRLGLLLLLPCIALTGVENLHKHCFYGVGEVRAPAVVELFEQLVRTGAVVGLLLTVPASCAEETLGVIVCGMIVCEIFSSSSLLFLFRRRFGREKTRAAPPYRAILRTAVPVGLTAVLGTAIGSVNAVLIPQLLVSGGASQSQAVSDFGVLFGMTMPLLALPTTLIGALGLVLVPKLAESVALGRWDAVRRQLTRALLCTSVSVMPCLAFLMVVGGDLGCLLFGHPDVGRFFPPLAAATLLGCYQSVLGTALNGLGKPAKAARNAILSSLFQLGLTLLLTGRPEVGLRGYVLGFLLSSALGLLLNWVDLARATRLRPRLFDWLLAPALSTLLMALCVRLFYLALLRQALALIPAVLLCLLLGALLYLLALFLQGLTPNKLLR